MPAPTFLESIGNTGYCMFGAESTIGTPVIPSVPAFMEDETLQTLYNFELQNPVAGSYMDTHQVLPGLRSHGGDLTIVAEPNTCIYFFDTLLERGSKTGSNPYTWPFTLGLSKSCTIDVSVGGGLVKRFWGCMTESVASSWSKNQLILKASISALGSFQGRKISATPTGTGPYTVVLDTTYTSNPTKGLVVGDLIRFYNASNALVDATVASIVDDTSFTTTTDVTAFAAGDMVYLRSATPTYSTLAPFLWSNTQFCFGADATTALSAAQTRLEQGTTWTLAWPFEDKNGSQRSGDADPASLVRLTAQPTFDAKKFFGNPQDILDFNQLNKNACVIRHYAYSGGNTYELRVTFNHLVTDSPMPSVSARKVNYSNLKFLPQEDDTDGQGFDVKVINGLSAIA